MEDMNRVLKVYWPCNFCIWFSYLLSPITFGLSFYSANLCIRDAKLGLISAIERMNNLKLREKGLLLTYV